MIQDIAPHKFDNVYHNQPPCPDSYVLYYKDRTALIRRTGDTFDFLRFRDLEDGILKTGKSEGQSGISTYTYLFSIDQETFYLAERLPGTLGESPARTLPEGCVMENIQFFRGGAPRYLAFAGITGYQLFLWYRSRRFCGRCGSPLRKDEKERMMYCDKCHQMEYPKISPAVIIGVTDGSRLLMSKYAGREYTRYALLAGFSEIGETLEETVKREVMEEVGLKVTNIRYYKNQPWSFSDTLLVGFFCDLEAPDEIRLDRNELALAQWFEREDIPLEDDSHASLTHEMIRVFKDNRLPLPADPGSAGCPQAPEESQADQKAEALHTW